MKLWERGKVLDHVYWIGGSACAGKSTLAEMYAKKYGLELYSCDDYFNEHLNSITDNYPGMFKVSKMNPEQAFVSRTIDEQLKVYIQSLEEDFQFVIKDLYQKGNKPIVVEGNQLLPYLVSPYLTKTHRGIWVIPTKEFQEKYYANRSWISSILDSTSNPQKAFANWMTRDALFANMVAKEAKILNLSLLTVDCRDDIIENFKKIEDVFNVLDSD